MTKRQLLQKLQQFNLKVDGVYEQFRVKQDRDYISEFDRDMVKYLKGSGNA